MDSKLEASSTYPARFEWLDAVHKCSHLFPKTKNIGWALYSHANKESLDCWPNLSHLEADLGGRGSSKNVRRHIRALELAGFIHVGQKMLSTGQSSNNYTLIEQGKDWECVNAHHDLETATLYGKKTIPHQESANHHDDALTLSLTPTSNTAKNTVINEPPAHFPSYLLSEDSYVSPQNHGGTTSLALRQHVAAEPLTADLEFIDVQTMNEEVAQPFAARPQMAVSGYEDIEEPWWISTMSRYDLGDCQDQAA